MKGLLPLLLFAVSLAGQQQTKVRLPGETIGPDKIVEALISAFDHADIVAMGDDHRRKLDSDFRIRLVRHPDFARKVRFIVVEFASTAQQSTLDRYIRGEVVPLAELEQVWKTTTQTNGVWDSPVYADFFAAVREVNQKLPTEARVRVLAGDPPTGSDLSRDVSAVSILKEQVLKKRGKALVIYGAGHLFRANIGAITKMLEADYPGQTFVVITEGGPYPEYQKFEHALKTPVRPVLVSFGRSPFRDLNSEEFLGRGMKTLVNGQWVSAFQGSGLTRGQIADACIYFGMAPEVDMRVSPDR
jgi:uncharacterized iron-regulated protein